MVRKYEPVVGQTINDVGPFLFLSCFLLSLWLKLRLARNAMT